MERYFVNDGEINIHVTEWGRENKPVIFCLHGLGSTSFSFIEIAEELKGDYRIFSIDAPGHGKTDIFTRAESYEMPMLANWLDKIIELLKIDKFYFLSHSWGSFVSLFYILIYSEKVLGTILIDGGYQSKRRGLTTMEEEVKYYEKDFEEYTDSWEEFLDVAVYGDSRRTDLLDLAAKDLVLVKDENYYWHARGKTAGNIIRGMHKDEIEDIYEKLPRDINILLLRASLPKSQEVYRDLTSIIFEQKTGATVKLIPDVSHMLHWDNPEVVIKEIRERW
ncbi:alpha/beta fold hydrolase [Niallia circulans]|uniref:Alpha/beta hydrolase n=1 Tax=Niallia circulans TaxID=1397 RepID=A0A941G8I2_NIACI|nr:alpha/beta hydrolase [Niallia circulans]MCB5235607.1 alpha/beta hydrolase [Niallia circulans]